MKAIPQHLYNVWLYIINYITKAVLVVIFTLKFNIRYRGLRELFSTRGPYLILPNHTNHWDPLLISFITPIPIRWVASDAAFRDVLKPILRSVGAIPKVKEQSDILALQEIKDAIVRRQAAGIFPEGAQNWDGITGELIPATAKLVRFLKVPVLVPVIKGGFLSKPRWTWNFRRCRIEVHFKRVIDVNEIETIKLSEIERRIKEALTYDEYAWQSENRHPVRSRHRAENLELALWICPSCREIGSLRSKGNTMACACGYAVEVDRFGFLQYPEGGPSFPHPRKWMEWQNNLFAGRIEDALHAEDRGELHDSVLLRDADLVLMRGERAKPMSPEFSGEARLYRNRIEVGDAGTQMQVFPLREITAVNTFKQQNFEFRFEKSQYRFQFPSRHVSGYKWEIAYKVLKKLLCDRGEW